MPENLKQKEEIEFGRNAKEPKTKGRDRKGSNLGMMPENPNQNKEIESGHNAQEPETKRRN